MNTKKCLPLVIFLFCMTNFLIAQIRLDVEGDAKIIGKLDLRRNANSNSILIGVGAGINDTTTRVQNNIYIGETAGVQNRSGINNTYIGQNAGYSSIEGYDNTFIGANAGRFSDQGGRLNTFIGSTAGTHYDGTANTFIGNNSGNMGSGDYNTLVGYITGGLGSGNFNTLVGSSAGRNSSDGYNNTFLGYAAGLTTGGFDNVSLGKHSGINNSKGIRTTLVGTGSRISPSLDSLSKAIALGFEAEVACHNCAVLGGVGNNAVKVGIDMTTPLWPLHIKTEKNAISGTNVDVTELGMVIARDVNGTNVATGIGFQSSTSRSTIGAAIIHERTGAASIGSLHFATKSSGASSVDIPIRMTLDKNGNLGIGVLAPQQNLDVSGNARIRTVPTTAGNEDYLRIDAAGNLYRSVASAPRIASVINSESLILEQKEQLNVKSEEIAILREENDQQNEVIKNLANELKELRFLVENTLAKHAIVPKKESFTLSLEQPTFLAQNQPNPFSENTMIQYELPANVKSAFLHITSIDGKILGKVKIAPTGKGQVEIKANSYPAGTYFYSLVVNGRMIATKRMVLTR